MQHNAAEHLGVEMALAEHAAGGFAHGGESRDEKVVQCFALRDFGTERICAGSQLTVGERQQLRLQRGDGLNLRRVGLETAVIGRAENLLRESTEPPWTFLIRTETPARWRAGFAPLGARSRTLTLAGPSEPKRLFPTSQAGLFIRQIGGKHWGER